MESIIPETNFIVQHNLPIATADHLAQFFKNVFPNSKIAASCASAKTKTFAIINWHLTHTFTASLLTTVKAIRSVLAMMDQMILLYKISNPLQ